MKISDAKLSAFLDQELSAVELAAIRDEIAENPELADRLAMLSQVDADVQKFARQIDSQQLAPELQGLLFANHERSNRGNNVVSLSFWQRTRQHFAVAASVTILLALGVFQFWPEQTDSAATQWTQVSDGLDSLPSGEILDLASGAILRPQFSFVAGDNRVCRSYEVEQVQPARQVRQEIACRQQTGWQVIASVTLTTQSGEEYRTASAARVLDDVLRELGAGPSLSLEEERIRLRQQD